MKSCIISFWETALGGSGHGLLNLDHFRKIDFLSELFKLNHFIGCNASGLGPLTHS